MKSWGRKTPFLVALGLAFVLSIAVYLAVGGRLVLQLEHAAVSWVARHSRVVDLEIPSVGKLKMFLRPDDKVITFTIMRTGIWEATETHWVSKLVKKGDTVLDLGANVGYYTLIAAQLVGEAGRVYAFEPDPVSFAILEKNVRLNGFRNVILEQKAVSNKAGSIQLFLQKGHPGDQRIYPFRKGQGAVNVEAVALDEYFGNLSGKIDFAKIDTQGAEGVIIEGMRRLMNANPDLIMAIEFWPYGLSGLGSDAHELLNRLTASGFRFFDLGPGAGPVRELRGVQTWELLQTFTVANRRFTNLLVLRGARALEQLTLN